MLKHWMAGGAFVAMAAVSALAQAPRQSEADQVRARQRISTMEGVLERAVMSGADNLVRQIDAVMPDAAMLSGEPQVRGFRLDGYGVFFDVEVPALRLSVSWMVRSMQSAPLVANAALNDLRIIQAGMTNRGERERLAQVIERLELSIPRAASPAPRAGRGGVSAAMLPQTKAAPTATENPDAAWTQEVKAALVDAMLEYSGPLEIADNEWLSVAARDNLPSDPLVPGDSVDTVIFRVKGSDLAALHARRLTKDEARKRVEIKEY